MRFTQLGPHQKWLLTLRRAKRSGSFLKFNIKSSELNSLIRKFKNSIRVGPIHLTVHEQEILELLPMEGDIHTFVTSSEIRHIPMTPSQESELDKEGSADWRRKVLFAATK